jgi:hypothetical protein
MAKPQLILLKTNKRGDDPQHLRIGDCSGVPGIMPAAANHPSQMPKKQLHEKLFS